jgi:hypothetical protein
LDNKFNKRVEQNITTPDPSMRNLDQTTAATPNDVMTVVTRGVTQESELSYLIPSTSVKQQPDTSQDQIKPTKKVVKKRTT